MGKGSNKGGNKTGVQKTIQKKTIKKSGPKVDETIRHAGTVKNYNKLNGYGFISMTAGVVPENEVFVHWKSIQSEDRFPFLHKELEVEFSLKNRAEGPVAWEVTLPGGEPINLQDESDANNKEFVGAQDTRYKGKLKFYDNRTGFGYITLEGKPPIAEIGSEIRVEKSEVNCGPTKTDTPNIPNDTLVEFGIWKTKKGAYKAYNMTMRGGGSFTRETLEHRQAKGGALYQGEISLWNWRQGWGFIAPSSPNAFPAAVKQALEKQAKEAKARAAKKGKDEPENANQIYLRRADLEPGTRLDKGTKVKFNLYTDDKGVGAMNLQVV